MRLNPIVKKDIKVQARSMKMAWGISAYEAILAGVFFIALLFISNQSITMILMYTAKSCRCIRCWQSRRL